MRRVKRALSQILKYALLVIAMFIFVLPMTWVVITSFKPPGIIMASPPVWFFEPTLEHYKAVLRDPSLINALRNSIVVSIASSAISLGLGSIAAYSMSRFRTGGQGLLYVTLVVRVLPPVALAIPFFITFRRIGLYDNLLSLILVYMTFNLPFTIWLLMAFFDDVPAELEDAARVDGCGRFGVFFRVSLPLIQSGLVVAGILTFMGSWNHFFFALILTSDAAKTLPVLAASYVTTWGIRWGSLAAIATLIMSLPVALVFTLQQRLVKGIAFGGMKG